MRNILICLVLAQYGRYMANMVDAEGNLDLDEISKIEMPDMNEEFTVDVDLTYPNELSENVYKTVENLDIQEAKHREDIDMYNDQINDHVEDVREDYFVKKDSEAWTGH